MPEAAVRAIHAKLLTEFGGLSGLARPDQLAAALARPRQLLAYAEAAPILPRLAAAYGYPLSRNHCFADVNKRIALAVIDVFLRMNGARLEAGEEEAAQVVRELAAGEIGEDEFAAWIAACTR